MRHALCAILWIAAFSPPAFVQPFDKARFRQAIEMPAIHIPFGVNFRSNERDGQMRYQTRIGHTDLISSSLPISAVTGPIASTGKLK